MIDKVTSQVKVLGGIRNTIWESLVSIFSNVPEVEEVLLYGSRAKGTFRPGSDIDLAFKGLKCNLRTIRKIDLKIDELDLVYLFDLTLYDYLKDHPLKDHIDRVGIPIYAKVV